MKKGSIRLAMLFVLISLLSGCVSSSLQALGSADAAQRARAVDTLVNAGSQALPHIQKLIDKHEYAKYDGAAQVLARIGGADALAPMQTMAADTAAPQEARLTALHALVTADAAEVEAWMGQLTAQGRSADALDVAKLLFTQPGEAGAKALQALCAAGDDDIRRQALQTMLAGRDVLTPWLTQLAHSGHAKEVAQYAALLADMDTSRAYAAWMLVVQAGEENAELRVQAVRATFALSYADALAATFDGGEAQLPQSIRTAALACLRPQDLSDRNELWIAEVGRAQSEEYRTALLAALRAIGAPAYRTLLDAVAAAGMQGSAVLRARDVQTPEGVLCALGRPAADAVAAQEKEDIDAVRLRYFAALLSAFGAEGADARLALLQGSASADAPGLLVEALRAQGDTDGAFALLKQGILAAWDPQRTALCAELLATQYDAQARPVLEPMLLSADGNQRNAAVAAFAHLSGAGAADTLKTYARNDDDGEAQAAMASLATLGEAGGKTLLSLAKQPTLSQARRLFAAQKLLSMDNGGHVADIQALLPKATDGLRQDLLGALAELKTDAAAKAITTAIPLGNQQQRMDIVKTLLAMGDVGKKALNALRGDALKPMVDDVTALIAEGMQGSETLLTNILNDHGTLAMANELLNSGNQTLYSAGEAWGKKNGYKVIANTVSPTATPSATATASATATSSAAWGSNGQ